MTTATKRTIFDSDNPNARWENNPEGLPAPDLGVGPDGKERDQYTEQDIQTIARNPITLVAMDAAVKDIISLQQAKCIGYKPLPRWPQGLTVAALNGAFLEIGKRILSGAIEVPEELKKKYTWIYELEHSGDANERRKDQEARSLDELEKRWAEFYERTVGAHKSPASDGDINVLAMLIEQFHNDVEGEMLANYPDAYARWPEEIWRTVFAAIVGAGTCAKNDVLAARKLIESTSLDHGEGH
jgi:hypothetical protein